MGVILAAPGADSAPAAARSEKKREKKRISRIVRFAIPFGFACQYVTLG